MEVTLPWNNNEEAFAAEAPLPTQSGRSLAEGDLSAFLQGLDGQAYLKLGSHLALENGRAGARFAVWAPNAGQVSVMGDFNDWRKATHPLQPVGASGVWAGFVPGITPGARYKYYLKSRFQGHDAHKADPFAFDSEVPPQTASVLSTLDYQWNDRDWMQRRRQANAEGAPVSIYEVHLGSWKAPANKARRWLSYGELAPQLAEYALRMGFTHLELLPVMEHPFYGSWGYQTTGFFAPTRRYGAPQEFMYLVDYLHQQGLGVILDWVPSHFPRDEHGLAFFDGTHLYEHADPRQGLHADWNSAVFNYGRNEVRSFLLSSALFWLDRYHADGLRLDAVASMLYLDYSRLPGHWIPNRHGGRENLEAVAFLRHLNDAIAQRFPDVLRVAEESTAWPKVSRPASQGGLGFSMKWDMGWMHDTLRYLKLDPIHRRFHQGELAFRMVYAFKENYILPLSHDEVVHGKGSLYARMPGDDWQRFASLRLLFGYMYSQPGKKLLFMGDEFAQRSEWNHEASLDWQASEDPRNAGVQKWVLDLNRLYRAEPALHEQDFTPAGFEGVDSQDAKHSTLSYLRKALNGPDLLLAVMNFTPVTRTNYRVGVPRGGPWRELLNSDAGFYGGSGRGNAGGVSAEPIGWHGRAWSVRLTLPPLAALFLVSRT